MLRLKGITKNYKVAGKEIQVLKGLDICFRKNEFVSILGPSGCGKTTTLNIVGGLDKYTSGDLFIAGKSTKNFNDRDWDSYRNHRIGFIFQSYNLIPHQTVLSNVELALTIAGVSKEERTKRSISALDRVGLKGEYYKRPNQLSGGQCQRVAIARALVNQPDILLADEPTGALDSKTSVQIMELIKEISKEKLVIMVTHNADIAQKYSTRIVKLSDGEIIEDSMPFTEQEEIEELEKTKLDQEQAQSQKVKNKLRAKKPKKERAKMSLWTAFKLSLRNLFTKRGRTILTSFAGSIGIIGISLILAVSQGTTAYINHVQKTTLSSYPLTIEETTIDLTSLINSFMNVGQNSTPHEKDAVYKEAIITDLVNALSKVETSKNDLKSFKAFLEEQVAIEGSQLNGAIAGLKYSYNFDFSVYTKNTNGNIIKSDTNKLMSEMLMQFMSGSMGNGAGSSGGFGSVGSGTSSGMMGMMSSNSGLWEEMLSGTDGSLINSMLKQQYDVIYGDWPNDYNEVVLVVNKNNEIDDLSLYALGFMSEEDIDKIINAAKDGQELPYDGKNWSYEDICKGEYKVVLPADCYTYDSQNNVYVDTSAIPAVLEYLYDNAITLKVTGIIRPNDKAESPMLTGSIAYTHELTEYVINQSKDKPVVRAQVESSNIDVISGLPFKEGEFTDIQKKELFLEYVASLSEAKKADKYIEVESLMTEQELGYAIIGKMMPYYNVDRTLNKEKVREFLFEKIKVQTGGVLSDAEINAVLDGFVTDEELSGTLMMYLALDAQEEKKQQIIVQNFGKTDSELATLLDQKLQNATDNEIVSYFDSVMSFSNTTYDKVLQDLGYIDLDKPSTIGIYASSFENKDIIVSAIEEYNQSVESTKQIKYTDYMGLLMSSVTQIVDAITYVLIAFVSISLIVSSIMIGVITLISVQERTKEIGILRAIGASKRDVSNMFNAETLIIGLTSGLVGITVTYLICIPINIILFILTGLTTLNAILPPMGAIILVLISMGLTLISGLIPSRSASKKDPVVALRTE